MDDVPDLNEEFDFEWSHRDEYDELMAMEDDELHSHDNQQQRVAKSDDSHKTISSPISGSESKSTYSRDIFATSDEVCLSGTNVYADTVRTRKRDDFDSSKDATVEFNSLDHLACDSILSSPLRKRIRKECVDLSSTSRSSQLIGSRLQSDDDVGRRRGSRDERQQILRRIPAGGFVALTSLSGTRVYLRLRPKDHSDPIKCATVDKNLNLLTASYDSLRMQIEKERESKLLAEIDSKIAESVTESYTDRDSDSVGTVDLWVERFKPNCYLELLSNDETNRSLLHWLKRWDKLVFGREVKCRPKKFEDDGKSFRFGLHADLELDQWHRPNKKVALLCGPPGLGKTTLAHIIARHAGYKPVEMNASDDRSAEAFKNQIEAATQMRSVIGQDPRPNCLIIDEIDGAPSAAVNVLVSVVTAKPTGSSVSDDGRSASNSKNRKGRRLLQRPIICICNDQYAPALRLLKSHALLLHFPPTVSSRLANRLMEISQAQGLQVDLSTLLALVEKTQTDIRSCLSTLQFVHSRNKQLQMTDILSVAVGQKDIQQGLFSVWQHVFSMPKPKRCFKVSQLEPSDTLIKVGQSMNTSDRFYDTLSLIQGYGDYDKIYLGLHENYPIVKCKDQDLSKANYGIDWLTFADRFTTHIDHSKNYSLMSYLPFTAVAFHLIFASTSAVKVQFPSAHYDFVTKQSRSQNIVEALVSELRPSMRIYLNGSVLVSDLLPSLLDIVCPTMRQVNAQLYSATEKQQLQRLLDIMIDFSLVYRQRLDDDGHYTYVLDHPIDFVATFTGLAPRKQLPYATKQLIAREVEQERMRKRDSDKNECDGIRLTDAARSAPGPSPDQIPSHLQNRAKLSQAEKPLRDFFGRIIEPKAMPSSKDEANNGRHGDGAKGSVWFHFKEGYSNAVRKNIIIDSLL